MKAVHFGPGNIGRGFIGPLLIQSGYDLTFIGRNENLLRKLKDGYELVVLEDEPTSARITAYHLINSSTDREQAIRAIAEADLITTAIGPNNLGPISELLAEGLLSNTKNPKNVNVIACENMINGSQTLKQKVLNHCSEEEKNLLEQWVGFPNAAVDRIVPTQKTNDSTKVETEPYFEWVIDKQGIKGDLNIPDAKMVGNFTPYINRKLFTVNTAHAIAAYAGYQMGMKTIREAIQHRDIRELIRQSLIECGPLMTKKFGFHPIEQAYYIDDTLKRFDSPHFTDPIDRVARSPKRKLSANERLFSPAFLLYLDELKEPRHLIKSCAIALHYHNPNDPEAKQIQESIQEHGVAKTFAEISELPVDHPMVKEVAKQYEWLHENGIDKFLKEPDKPKLGYFPRPGEGYEKTDLGFLNKIQKRTDERTNERTHHDK